MEMIKKDAPYIIVIIITLIACYLTLASAGGKVQEAYNNCDDFINEWCDCKEESYDYNYSEFNIKVGEVYNEVHNYSKDREG